MIHISTTGLHLIEQFEGYRSEAYQDQTGVWTIGYGTTTGAGIIDVHEGLTCTEEEAQHWLGIYCQRSIAPALEDALAQRSRSLRHRERFSQNAVDALFSLSYNLGAGITQAGHTIGNDIRTGKPREQVADDFLLYDVAGGVVNEGLVNRRHTERALFLTPGPVAS